MKLVLLAQDCVGSHASWKILECPEIFIGKFPGPGKSWILLGNDADNSFWLLTDMFLRTKIAIIVAIRYVFWAAGMLKMLSRLYLRPVAYSTI